MDKKFLVGMGLGMVAGGALSMAATPRRRSESKRMMDRAVRGMENVVDDLSALLGK